MLLPYAALGERQGGPFAESFGDMYYTPGDGIAESEHTFLHGNGLFARFAALTDGERFTIAETGFGTGLNCFLTAHHFLRLAPHARLTYISAEKHPIHPRQLPALHHGFPALPLREAFYRQNPANHAGFHLIHLHPRVDLLLLLGDAAEQYAELDARVDAWYLDGFAPAKNPGLWTEALWREMARLSHSGTTAASFTAARAVRDGLAQAGFAVERVAGYGRKRHMIRARCLHPAPAAPQWHDRPAARAQRGPVAVIGAGIAGSATAYALARSGLDVHLYHDAAQYPPASAVPVAIPYLQPGLTDTPQRRYQLTAWHYAQRFLHELTRDYPQVFTPCPINRLPQDAAEAARHQALYAQQLLDGQHWQLQGGILRDTSSGIVHLPELCAALTASPRIRTQTLGVETLTRSAEGWQTGGTAYENVVLCCGWQTALLPEPYARDALRPLRGQGTVFGGQSADAVYCGEKTLIPMENGCYAGASFQPNDSGLDVRREDRHANHLFARQFASDSQPQSDFVGIRAACRDYLPLVGGIATSEALARDYAAWQKNARLTVHAAPHYHAGLYLHAGLGSKGCTYTFLNAALLAACLHGTALPLARTLLPHLVPARFFIRILKRGQV